MADREEADLPLEKTDIYKIYWLDRNFLLKNPLLTVLLPNKVTVTKGRPCKTAMFVANKEGVF